MFSIRIFLLIVFSILYSNSVLSQKVFAVDYSSQADIKVFVAKYASQADLLVFKVDYPSQAKENKGKWFFVKYNSHSCNNWKFLREKKNRSHFF